MNAEIEKRRQKGLKTRFDNIPTKQITFKASNSRGRSPKNVNSTPTRPRITGLNLSMYRDCSLKTDRATTTLRDISVPSRGLKTSIWNRPEDEGKIVRLGHLKIISDEIKVCKIFINL